MSGLNREDAAVVLLRGAQVALEETKAERDALREQARALRDAAGDVLAAYDKQVQSYRDNDDDAVADIAERVHGKRMERLRAALASTEPKP